VTHHTNHIDKSYDGNVTIAREPHHKACARRVYADIGEEIIRSPRIRFSFAIS
jgi:hypothetical protein